MYIHICLGHLCTWLGSPIYHHISLPPFYVDFWLNFFLNLLNKVSKFLISALLTFVAPALHNRDAEYEPEPVAPLARPCASILADPVPGLLDHVSSPPWLVELDIDIGRWSRNWPEWRTQLVFGLIGDRFWLNNANLANNVHWIPMKCSSTQNWTIR